MLVVASVVINITRCSTILIALKTSLKIHQPPRRRRQLHSTPQLPRRHQRVLFSFASCHFEFHTLAMLDDGSQTTLCSESLIRRLNAPAKISPLTLIPMSGQTKVEKSRVLDLKVAAPIQSKLTAFRPSKPFQSALMPPPKFTTMNKSTWLTSLIKSRPTARTPAFPLHNRSSTL